MDSCQVQTHIESIENNAALYDARNFEARAEAMDFIGFQVIEYLSALMQQAVYPQLILLKERAEKLQASLETVNCNLFQQLRAKIREGDCAGTAFKNMVKDHTHFTALDNGHPSAPGYDILDEFINGLCSCASMPRQTKDLEPGMIYFQKTPARIIFELVGRMRFTSDDVFVDIGSGLGQAAILVNLLTGIKTIGLEFEPAFCDYARHCSVELNLCNTAFINMDARDADYTGGTVFFMYTPFSGAMLQTVLKRLRLQSLQRKITLITYGPCTATVGLQDWLHAESKKIDDMYTLAVFTSLQVE